MHINFRNIEERSPFYFRKQAYYELSTISYPFGLVLSLICITSLW